MPCWFFRFFIQVVVVRLVELVGVSLVVKVRESVLLV